ncbi:MAG: DUF1385 domain-containing protein [Oscillospiraceae bacterium]
MNKKNPNEKFKSKIGGQALIEGIMMKGVNKGAMACRLPTGEIDVEEWDVKGGKNAPWYRKIPFVRGSVVFVSSLIEGYKYITKSAEKQGNFDDDDGEEMSEFEKKLVAKFGDKLMTIMSVIAVIIGVALCLVLFMALPMLITNLLKNVIHSQMIKTIIEGCIKIALFIGYLAVISKMKSIQRTFEYHGAEHKTIACYEAGEELTVENVRSKRRFHPRCGTSFLIIVLIISVLVFSLLTWENMVIRIVLKVALLPLVCGIAYEIIRLAGKYDNVLTRIVSAPGMALQRLTTREPDDKEIECAIAALKPCIPQNKEDDQW